MRFEAKTANVSNVSAPIMVVYESFET